MNFQFSWGLSWYFSFPLDEFISATEHPALAGGIAATICLLLMRGTTLCFTCVCQIVLFFYTSCCDGIPLSVSSIILNITKKKKNHFKGRRKKRKKSLHLSLSLFDIFDIQIGKIFLPCCNLKAKGICWKNLSSIYKVEN